MLSRPPSSHLTAVRKLLLQLDTSPRPSVFDRVVAYDGGADEVMSYGGITEDAVRDLVHGAIFTRGPKDLHNTAIFIGGTDMARRRTAAGRGAESVLRSHARVGDARLERIEHDGGGRRREAAAGVRCRRRRRSRPQGGRHGGHRARSDCAPRDCSRRRARDVLITSRRAADSKTLDGASAAVRRRRARGHAGRRVAGRRRARRRRTAPQRGSGRRAPRAARRLGGPQGSARGRGRQRRAAAPASKASR